MIQVPLVLVQGEQQPVGFGVFGHEFIERQIGKPKRFVASWGQVLPGRMIAKGVCGSTASVATALG